MTSDHKPSIGTIIRFADGWEAKVTEHTERGFKCLGAAGRFSHPRLGYHSTGEYEVFTDTPEYRIGARGFSVVSEPDSPQSIHGFISDMKSPIVEVFYIRDHPPFVCGINGHYCAEMIENIEETLSEDTENTLDKGNGNYLYRATYVAAQHGENGRLELPAYWDLSYLAFRPI